MLRKFIANKFAGNNRKLRKLILNPKQYFLDAKDLQPIFNFFGIENKKAKVESTLPIPKTYQKRGMEGFDLIGANWEENTSLPLAVVYGFPSWKQSFLASYLPEYRVAFVSASRSWSKVQKVLRQFDELVFVLWGCQEHEALQSYARQHQVKILRIEDGFIRSSQLGSKHSLPLSLAIDHEGMYFDARVPSDLENLLQNRDFSATPDLLMAAERLMAVYRDLGISKYNMGAYRKASDILGIKLKRRVLVIGQVEDDASIRYGGALEWSCKRLLELAVTENPDCEIVYRPHPDVVQGFRTNSAELDDLKKICTVLSEDVVLADLFSVVDHVYTMTSLAGMEALIHGLKVTVVGAPFYAGWGLTDDRLTIPRRTRRLSIVELFCGAYLCYPRYLPDLEDPVTGCLGAILRIVAERKKNLISGITPKFLASKADWLARSEYWPVLLKPAVLAANEKKLGKNISSLVSVDYIFSGCEEEYYKKIVAYYLLGCFAKNENLFLLLGLLRSYVNNSVFKQILIDLWFLQPRDQLLEHWEWCCEQCIDAKEPRQTLERVAFDHYTRGSLFDYELLRFGKFNDLIRHAKIELTKRNLANAEELFVKLLLSGCSSIDVFHGLADIGKLRFDFLSAAKILSVSNIIYPFWRGGGGYARQAQLEALSGNTLNTLSCISVSSLLSAQFVQTISSFSDLLHQVYGVIPFSKAMLCAIEFLDAGDVIARARTLISHEQFESAVRLLLAYSPDSSEIEKYGVALSQAYSYQGNLDEARKVICELLRTSPVLLVYREALRLAVICSDYVWGKKLLDDSIGHGLDVGEMYFRKISFGCGDIKNAYSSFRLMSRLETLRTYFGEAYVQSVNLLDKSNGASNVVLGFFGPGDEIRFASLYADVVDAVKPGKVLFTCDPRLLNLFQRYYKDLDFVPSARIRNLSALREFDSHNQLPGSDLHPYFDNHGWAVAKCANKIILSTDIIGDFIHDYSSFSGKPYLIADESRIEFWRSRLQCFHKCQLFVGLSWRSSLTTHSRNEHYLSIEDLLPLFDLPNVTFVNLQYDDCSQELAWLEERCPGRLVSFADLDQYNDLDGVAALMNCLDLIIAPATTVFELSGALGRPTWLLSNSSELHWRKLPGTHTDVWHRSVTHVEAPKLGDKIGLVQAVRQKLDAYIKDSTALQYTPQVQVWKTEA